MTHWYLGMAIVASLLALIACWQCLRLRRLLIAEREAAEQRWQERENLVRAQATAAERERIHSDLHDDIGAKLLGMIHRAKTPADADQARALLQDLRDVVTRSRGMPGTLLETLAEIRSEVAQRLSAAGIGLRWELADDLPDPQLATDRVLHLYRIVREAVSNVIRHAHASHVRVRVKTIDDRLYLDLTDDGSGVDQERNTRGSGLGNMRSRASELAGDIRWAPGTEGGLKVLLTMPLPEASA
jgi:signal transduction histidine kinase